MGEMNWDTDEVLNHFLNVGILYDMNFDELKAYVTDLPIKGIDLDEVDWDQVRTFVEEDIANR